MYKADDELIICETDSDYIINYRDKYYMIKEYKDYPLPKFIVKIIKEYIELRIRYNKLFITITKYYTNELNFNLTRNELDLMKKQSKSMFEYMYSLEKRCELYNINLQTIYNDVVGEIYGY